MEVKKACGLCAVDRTVRAGEKATFAAADFGATVCSLRRCWIIPSDDGIAIRENSAPRERAAAGCGRNRVCRSERKACEEDLSNRKIEAMKQSESPSLKSEVFAET